MTPDIVERIAVIQAHRAIRGVEHDGARGLFHGDCYVCGVPFPCEYVGNPPKTLPPLGITQAVDLLREMEREFREEGITDITDETYAKIAAAVSALGWEIPSGKKEEASDGRPV